MGKKPAMKLVSYEVNLLEWKKNESYKQDPDHELTIKPSFIFECLKADDDSEHYLVRLTCNVFEEAEKNNYPFSCQVIISGGFFIFDEENKDKLLKYNAVAVLLPYVRSLVSQITVLAEMPSLHLPIFNVYELQDNAHDLVNDKKNPKE